MELEDLGSVRLLELAVVRRLVGCCSADGATPAAEAPWLIERRGGIRGRGDQAGDRDRPGCHDDDRCALRHNHARSYDVFVRRARVSVVQHQDVAHRDHRAEQPPRKLAGGRKDPSTRSPQMRREARCIALPRRWPDHAHDAHARKNDAARIGCPSEPSGRFRRHSRSDSPSSPSPVKRHGSFSACDTRSSNAAIQRRGPTDRLAAWTHTSTPPRVSLKPRFESQISAMPWLSSSSTRSIDGRTVTRPPGPSARV